MPAITASGILNTGKAKMDNERVINSKILDLGHMANIEQSMARRAELVYAAAIHYVECGFFIVPLRKNMKVLPEKKYNVTYAHASNDVASIQRWFNPKDGQFAGHNIGIATGRTGGCFALDVDIHDPKKDGRVTLGTLTQNHGTLPIGPLQKTPSGGLHYLYRWQDNLMSSTGKLGAGLDTRGGKEDAFGGHIVVFPSMVDGSMYRWESGGSLPVCPKWIADGLGVSWSNKKPMGRGNENMGDEDEMQPLPRSQVLRMLDTLRPDHVEYDDWLRVGMAIKSQYPDEEGADMWDAWSAKGARYKPRECYSRWGGFGEGGVTMGSLVYMAKQAGYISNHIDDIMPANIKATVQTEGYNETYAIVLQGGKVRVVDTTKNFRLISRADFLTLKAMDRVIGDDGKSRLMAEVWLASPNRRTYDEGMGVYPKDCPPDVLNVYAGLGIEPQMGHWPLLRQHIRNIVCGGDGALNLFLLDWCADLIQDPAKPKGTSIVMRGAEGTGKGTLANLLQRIIGKHAVHIMDEDHLTGNFNGHLGDMIFVFADEATWGGNKKTAGKLKGMVTEPTQLIERKGFDAVTVINMIHLMIATNSDWAIPTGGNSRRWLMLDVPNTVAKNEKYFNALYNEIDNGGAEAFLFDMQARAITSNLRTAPITEALKEQAALTNMSSNTIAEWWGIMLQEKGARFDDVIDPNSTDFPAYLAKGDPKQAYDDYCRDNRKRPSVTNFHKKLVEWGAVPVRIKAGNGTADVYRLKPWEEMVEIYERATGTALHTGDWGEIEDVEQQSKY